MTKVYFSFDIEADGEVPSLSNMLALGIWILDEQGNDIDSWQRNIKETAPRKATSRCIKDFWDKQPEAWKAIHTDQVTPQQAMSDLADLIKKYSEYQITWLARPAAYDWQWVKGYYEEFAPSDSPAIGFSALCLSSMWGLYQEMNHLGKNDRKELWKKWAGDAKMSHQPVDDAHYQANIFKGLMKATHIWN